MLITRIALGVAKKTPSILLFFVLVVLTAWGASSNWQYGYSLGRSGLEGQMIGAGSVAFDVLKVIAAALAALALAKRQWATLAYAASAYLVAFLWSVLSATGYMQDVGASKVQNQAAQSPEFISEKSKFDKATQYLSKSKSQRDEHAVKSDILAVTSASLSSLTLPSGTTLRRRTDGKTVADWLVCEIGKKGRGAVSMAYCPILEKLYIELAKSQNRDKMQIQMALSASNMKQLKNEADSMSEMVIGVAAIAGRDITPEGARSLISAVRVAALELGTLLTSLLFGSINSSGSKGVQLGGAIESCNEVNQKGVLTPFERPAKPLIERGAIEPPKALKSGVSKRLIKHLSGVAENGKALVTLGDISGAVGVAKNTARNALKSLQAQGLIEWHASSKGVAITVL